MPLQKNVEDHISLCAQWRTSWFSRPAPAAPGSPDQLLSTLSDTHHVEREITRSHSQSQVPFPCRDYAQFLKCSWIWKEEEKDPDKCRRLCCLHTTAALQHLLWAVSDVPHGISSLINESAWLTYSIKVCGPPRQSSFNSCLVIWNHVWNILFSWPVFVELMVCLKPIIEDIKVIKERVLSHWPRCCYRSYYRI